MSLAVGTKLGPYEILAPIGAGGPPDRRGRAAERDIDFNLRPRATGRTVNVLLDNLKAVPWHWQGDRFLRDREKIEEAGHCSRSNTSRRKSPLVFAEESRPL